MNIPKHLFLALLLLLLLAASPASAAILYESGTLGTTGIPVGDVGNTVPGTNVKDSVFTGVRFQLSEPVVTSQVGGHFVSGSNGTFFGAIVALDDGNDTPDSGDFSTPDFLGATLLTFPTLSDEVFGNLTLSLDAGWYAMVFGSGLFGADTNGVTVRNGTDIGTPDYIGYQPGFGWSGLTPFFDNHRFVINGAVVPEPASLALACCACVFSFLHTGPICGIFRLTRSY